MHYVRVTNDARLLLDSKVFIQLNYKGITTAFFVGWATSRWNYNSFFCWLELQQFFLLAGITTVYKWEIGDA